jgi:hypothetical protein
VRGLIDFVMLAGPLVAGVGFGVWWGKRSFWATLLENRRLGQAAAEQLALQHGLKLELYDLGGG